MSEDCDGGDNSTGSTASPEEPTADTGTTCTECGTPIETSDWYPIRTDRDDDGDLRLYPFCSEDCQAAWLAERDG